MNATAEGLELAKTAEIGKQIDKIVSECLPAAMNASGFNEALTLAKGVKTLREIFQQNPEIKESVNAMANTPLGFVTDRSPSAVEAAKKKQKTLVPYNYDEIAECCIEAMLRGYRITGNEFNIMSGRFYAAKDGKYRKIIEHPGITDFRFTTTPPVYSVENRMSYGNVKQDQFAKVRCFASWKKDGSKQFIGKDAETGTDEDTLTFKIKAYGNDDDQVIGKALSKLFSRVLMRITGQIMPEMTDIDDTAITVEATDAPATTAEKPTYDIQEPDKPGAVVEEPEKPPVFDGHRTSPEGPPEGVNMDGSKKVDPPSDEKVDTDSTYQSIDENGNVVEHKAKPIDVSEFHRKRIDTVKALLDDQARVDATPDHVLRALWTKCEQNKWDIQHPKYLAWKDAQSVGKSPQGILRTWTGAPTDKIGDDPGRTALKRLHATIREKGLEPNGVQPIMFDKFIIESSKDILFGHVNEVINWLDDITPAKNLIYQLADAQRIMADSGKKIDLIALAISKLKETYFEQCGSIEHLYQIYDKPQLIEWVLDNMDSWLSEPAPEASKEKQPEQKTIAPTMIPDMKNVYDVVCYAADLTGTPKDDPLSKQFHELAASVQYFIMEGFDIDEKQLAAKLPEGIGKKFRDHFVTWFETQKG